MPKVSVIIATHNRANLLPNAVASARNAGHDLEIIVVDDASSDETREVCAAMSDVRYLRLERNQRLGGARNLAIMAASGEYITYLDDDDLRLPDSLDLQVEALERAPSAGFAYGQSLLADQNGVLTGQLTPQPCPEGDVFWELLGGNFIACPSVLFRRSCLFAIGLPTTAFPGVEDWDLWIRIAELFPVVAVRRPVVIYRVATAASRQFTSDAAGMVTRTTAAYRTRWITLPRARSAPYAQQSDARRRFSFWMARHLLWESFSATRQLHFGPAARNLWTAVWLHPLGVMRSLAQVAAHPQLLRRAARGERPHAGRRAQSLLAELPAPFESAVDPGPAL